MTRLLKPAVALVFASLAWQAWAVDAHQIVVPQSDGIAIEPAHRAHVLSDQQRNFQLKRDGAFWMVMEPARSRALIPEEEARLAAEEASLNAAPKDSTPVAAATLHFSFNRAKPVSWSPLAKVLNQAQTSSARITVVGHADEVGTAQYNKRLSEVRANEVRRYLTAKGVDPARISVEGRGKLEPVAPGDGVRNRRAVIDVLAFPQGAGQ